MRRADSRAEQAEQAVAWSAMGVLHISCGLECGGAWRCEARAFGLGVARHGWAVFAVGEREARRDRTMRTVTGVRMRA